MNVLILNCGSSTVKFQLIATDLDDISRNADHRVARGVIERIGGEAIITSKVEGHAQQRSTANLRDMRAPLITSFAGQHQKPPASKGIRSIADITPSVTASSTAARALHALCTHHRRGARRHRRYD
jgi:acetate kinase